MTWAQDQRIAYIKERIDHGLPVTRAEVGARFNCTIQTVTATFHKLKARYPGAMAYDEKAKAYRRADLVEGSAGLSWKERALTAEAKAAELQRVFDVQWKADQRAIKLWQAAHPGKDLVWPDRCNMVVWLLDQMDRAELEHLGDADSLRDRTLERTVKAQELLTALKAVLKVRPANWDDDEDPEQVAAWTLVASAVGEEAR